ncbi:hypothetical protein [Curtobacterium ammoniigenes]|uniref:hypothetical protein n=1 Tax=Curtobacterium ammoniigenes TaxID=395387 RepID=UPI000836F535|nr:hypothetical protein [Curtobacterium ammoniigenes]
MTHREANELAAQLWRLRELLETLLFKYDEQLLLLGAGRARWASRGAREIEIVAEQLHDCRLATSVTMGGAGAAWQLPEAATLRALAMGAPGVWREILTDHFEALLGLIAEVETMDAEWGARAGAGGYGGGADPRAAARDGSASADGAQMPTVNAVARPGVYSAQVAELIGI